MQLFKNKKALYICISILVVALFVVMILVMIKKSSSGKSDKHIEAGMTLVDTLGKGEKYETKVYLTEDKRLLLCTQNAEYAGLYLEKTEAIYDTYIERDYEDKSIDYIIIFDMTASDEDAAKECDLNLTSDVLGLELSVKVSITTDVEYISGSYACNEVDRTNLPGYQEFAKEFGEPLLSDDAIIVSLNIEEGSYYINEDSRITVDQGTCTFVYDGRMRKINIMSKSDMEKLAGAFLADNPREITVNDVPVKIMLSTGEYTAFYAIGDKGYMNLAFASADNGKDKSDKELIKLLEPFVKNN